ncbi:hypothetical protein [Streptococcus loxodontisalivarius]|uniref:Uncharacterized protein n=1 Tax=Streptococcus loxodontisalivarius TaxID=1349415 RepID=A0ABS2PSB0_9STRE|nr:hypothetical protein [Streptococcus loxodontisalivarius]MBM7642929.1 hypothetical protein [Streptococcus loxodontisalivarius]
MSQKPSGKLSYQILSSFIFITLYLIGMIRSILLGNTGFAILWGGLLIANLAFLIYNWIGPKKAGRKAKK